MLLGMCIEECTAAKRVLDELGIELESLRAVLAEMKEKTESTQKKNPPEVWERMSNACSTGSGRSTG